MTLSDAARILLHRDHFPDLDHALALVGVRLGRPAASQASAPPSTGSGPDDLGIDEDPLDDERRVGDGWSDAGWTDAETHRHEHPGAGLAPGRSDGRGAPRSAPTSVSRPQPVKVIASVLDPVEYRRPTTSAPPQAYESVPRSEASRTRTIADTDVAFETRTVRADLRAAVRVTRGGHSPDMQWVVDTLARARPLVAIRMLRRPAPPAAVRVLVETDLQTGPYADDIAVFLDAVRRLFGDDRLESFGYAGSPDRGCGPGPIWTWMPLDAHPPAAATLLVRAGHRPPGEDERRIARLTHEHRDAGQRLVHVVVGSRLPADARPGVDEWHLRD